MKKLLSISALVLVCIIAVSCGKVEKILPKQDGTWRSSSTTYREFVANALDTTYTETFNSTMVFEKDGTGYSYETNADSTDAFTWSVNDDNDVVTICQDFFGLQFCVPFEVLESSKDSQTWVATTESGTAGTYTESEATFTRVK
jgi:hypothetical protein